MLHYCSVVARSDVFGIYVSRQNLEIHASTSLAWETVMTLFVVS